MTCLSGHCGPVSINAVAIFVSKTPKAQTFIYSKI